MRKVNALKIRQAFGKVLKDLEKGKEPILIEKGRNPVAVLISINEFKERFIDYREKQKKEEVLELARSSASSSSQNSLKVLRELRYGSSH